MGSPTPVNGVVATDNGSGAASDLAGTSATTGQVWVGGVGFNFRSGSGKVTTNGAGLSDSSLPIYAKGNVSYSASWGVANNEGVSKQHRVMIWKDSTNYCRINLVGSTTKSATLSVALANVSRTVGTFAAGTIPNSAAYAEYAMTLACTLTRDGGGVVTGGTLSGTLNGARVSGALTLAEATMLAEAEFISYGSNSATGSIDNISVSCVGLSTFGPFRTVHLFNGSVPGTTLDYQTSDANSARRSALLSINPDVVFLSGGHNFGLDTPAAFLTKLDDAVAKINANLGPDPDPDPDPAIIVTSQNPEFVGANDSSNVAAHNARQRALRAHAKEQGWGYLPAFEVFSSRLDQGKSLINTDGIHPLYGVGTTLAQGNGSMLWGDVLGQYLRPKAA